MTQSEPKSKSGRSLLWIGGILGGLALVFAIFMGMRMNSIPSDLGTSTTRLSENGIFNVSYAPSTDAVPVNQMHEWTLHVETADGQEIEAGPGDIVVVTPETPHKFKNIGTDRLEIICIHSAPRMIQVELEE